MIFQQAGAAIKTIPIDADGLDVIISKKHFVKAAFGVHLHMLMGSTQRRVK
jgi:hypothetical protein